MAAVLVLGGLALLALPGALRRLGRQLPPAEWARLSALVLVVGAAVAEAATVTMAVPTVLRAVGVPALAAACERMLGPLVPGGRGAGWAAAVVAVALPALAAVGALRTRRSQRLFHIEPWLGRHQAFDGYELVVLPTDSPMALAVDGPRPQVVVSEGLCCALSPAELEAVLHHEAAHLAHGHQRYLLLATAVEHAFVFWPLARRSTKALRAALERWADESAAGGGTASRAVVRCALLRVTGALVDPALAAFSAAETVVERLDALGAAPPRPSALRRAGVYLPGLLLGAGVLVLLGVWAGEVRAVVAMAGRCPA